MNKNPNNRRSRGRGGNKRHGNVRNQTFESNGPGVKVRGSAQQVLDKYLTLARDASSSGDRIMAESYFQFAEHYFRLLNVDDQRNGERGGANRRGNGRDRMETPGGAMGGPDDYMSGDYDDDDMDNDGDGDETAAEVIRTDRPQADEGTKANSDDAGEQARSDAEPRDEAGGEADDARPSRRGRGRRRKGPEAQAELPMDSQSSVDSQSDVQPEQPAATAAAD
ncbi:MAG: hypothetical protein COW30_17750 [Rhodospirillales bacterium CG15_BIG_FIL_POST_REV_8_21_14_020_66_15]|nr:MAG: hypothetical protein COW30_17750 [Rhodospirillales bacterium CG15_BIG_FIL_POST_REV_8_21_14_020_66_15]